MKPKFQIIKLGKEFVRGELHVPLTLPEGWHPCVLWKGGYDVAFEKEKVVIQLKKPFTPEERILMKMEGREKFFKRITEDPCTK